MPVKHSGKMTQNKENKNKYRILMHQKAYEKADSYFMDLKYKKVDPGTYLLNKLEDLDLFLLSSDKFIEVLINTKKPQIFAESEVYGDGSDWNQTELSILGDISICVPVTVFDNGLHYDPVIHKDPFNATLLYTPGALLRNGTSNTPADWDEVIQNGQINYKAYHLLYERRLLPLFLYADQEAGSENKKALITIPGIGCGKFAGKFRGRLGSLFAKTIKQILIDHRDRFPNIKAVYYDPYGECDNERYEIGEISLMIRPLKKSSLPKAQLCKPHEYEEGNDNFSDCELFSFVAWDHVSWPGNDFYIGSRATDDGVKAAATNSMEVLTGIRGAYNKTTNQYDPPEEFRNWEDVVLQKNLQISVAK